MAKYRIVQWSEKNYQIQEKTWFLGGWDYGSSFFSEESALSYLANLKHQQENYPRIVHGEEF